ncbi:DNA replication/repair protein RecF [Aurantivibrio plasticivorans]
MAVHSLQIQNLRNLKGINLSLHPRLNLFYGKNGSGKTSLLESVNVLALGRSFRSYRPKPLINYDSELLTVFGEISTSGEPHKVGVQKSVKGESVIRVDGSNLSSASALAEYLPVLAIDAHSFEFIEGSAKRRRQLLDWLAFHVEPLFLPAWKALQHCLKQRNSLLRRGRISGSELQPWDLQLASLAEQIHVIRERTFNTFHEAVSDIPAILDGVDIEFNYRPGWKVEQGFREVLAESLEQDLQRGYTYYGPHRADIRITANKYPAADVLSRGQQKVLTCRLIVAQGAVFNQLTQRRCVFLIDDLPAELDEVHQALLAKWLMALDVQILITGVDKKPLLTMWTGDKEDHQGNSLDAQVFHVEHGQITPDNNKEST